MPARRSSSTSSPTTSRSTRSSNAGMRHPSPIEENFASPQLTNPRTQDVFQSIVKGRKSWKTLRGGEVVWPPELEAALIEGLENYIPDDSRETRLLGRFPLRNRFISDWIFDKTGKRRSAKQVGSRLQQLRDTCGGRKLLNLLTPRKPIPKRSSSLSPDLAERICPDGSSRYQDTDSSCSDRSSPGAPTTPTEVHATLQSLLYRGIACSTESPPNSVVYIDLLPGPSGPSKAFPDSSMPSSKQDEYMWAERGMDVVRISPQARYIAEIDPTVTFASPCLINAVSVFSVYLDDELVYSEDSPLEAAGALSPSHGTYLYSTSLLPTYWGKICQTHDLSRHTVIHRVVEERPSGTPASHTSKVLFSTMYRFRYSSPNLQLFGDAFDGCADLLSPPQQKVQNLRLDVSSPFDSMLHMSPPEVYYEKQQHYYDMAPWNNGTSIASYSH